MTAPDPWLNIATPHQDFSVRLANVPCLVPIYWAKDSEGRCQFIVTLDGNHEDAFRSATPNAQGIDIDLRTWRGSQILLLTLVSERERDLFYTLCEQLGRQLNRSENRSHTFPAIISHLRRWQRFLAGRPREKLTDAKIRGLYAELQFLRSLYQSHLSQQEAIESWCGPTGGDQDFVFRETAVEVKAVSVAFPNEVNIASEAQLDPIVDRLFLAVYALHQNAGKANEESLDELVQKMEGDLEDGLARDAFWDRLASASYVGAHRYDTPVLGIYSTRFFRVEGSFPRIHGGLLPEGIHRVRYQLTLDRLQSYQRTFEHIHRSEQ